MQDRRSKAQESCLRGMSQTEQRSQQKRKADEIEPQADMVECKADEAKRAKERVYLNAEHFRFGDLKEDEEDVAGFKTRLENLWTPLTVTAGSRQFEAEQAIVGNERYWRCVQQYMSRHFEMIWGFKTDKHYVHHKIIKVTARSPT